MSVCYPLVCTIRSLHAYYLHGTNKSFAWRRPRESMDDASLCRYGSLTRLRTKDTFLFLPTVRSTMPLAVFSIISMANGHGRCYYRRHEQIFYENLPGVKKSSHRQIGFDLKTRMAHAIGYPNQKVLTTVIPATILIIIVSEIKQFFKKLKFLY